MRTPKSKTLLPAATARTPATAAAKRRNRTTAEAAATEMHWCKGSAETIRSRPPEAAPTHRMMLCPEPSESAGSVVWRLRCQF